MGVMFTKRFANPVHSRTSNFIGRNVPPKVHEMSSFPLNPRTMCTFAHERHSVLGRCSIDTVPRSRTTMRNIAMTIQIMGINISITHLTTSRVCPFHLAPGNHQQ